MQVLLKPSLAGTMVVQALKAMTRTGSCRKAHGALLSRARAEEEEENPSPVAGTHPLRHGTVRARILPSSSHMPGWHPGSRKLGDSVGAHAP